MNQSNDTPDWVLYSTEACHLCDLAKDLVIPLARSLGSTLTFVDVSETDELMSLYGVRIPVLQRTSDGAELNWPFDAAGLQSFLHNLHS